MNSKLKMNDSLVVGFALFAMFFGAGNLIFPPDIGIRGGTTWALGYIFYFIADVGLAVMGVFAMLKSQGSLEKMGSSIGKIPAVMMNTAVILCIGPCLAIPRTAAAVFELGVLPITGIDASNTKIPLAIFSIIFFAIVLILTIRPSKVIDIVGKILTPLLLITLVVLIITGILNPLSSVDTEATEPMVKYGLYNGYQTMDAFASIFFINIIITTFKNKGYTEGKQIYMVTVKATVIAGLLLFLVYGGLSYLGASTVSHWTQDVLNGTMNQAALLINITHALLGKAGIIVLGLIAAFACLTTAIGLTSATAEYFEELSGGKLSYTLITIITCVFSAFICNLGLSQIISISAPILVILYPVMIMLMITAIMRSFIPIIWAFRVAVLVTFIVSIISTLCDMFGFKQFNWVHELPLDSYGFNWVVPALTAFLLSAIVLVVTKSTDKKLA